MNVNDNALKELLKQIAHLKQEIDNIRRERRSIIEFEKKELRKVIDYEIRKLKEFVRESLAEISSETGQQLSKLQREGKKINHKIDSAARKKAEKKAAQTVYSFEKQAERHLVDTLKHRVDTETLKMKDDLREAERRAITDELTRTFNRRYFMPRLELETDIAKRVREIVSVLLIDIDKFKDINDTYGHPAGDSVLAELSSLLRGLLRREDVLGRYGGEEFIVILPGIRKELASATAQRLRREVKSHPFYWEGSSFNISISIGLAVFPEEASDYKELLQRADKRLLKAKREGRDRVADSE